jgi:hypothetical protein
MIKNFAYIFTLILIATYSCSYAQNKPQIANKSQPTFIDKSKESVWGGDILLSITNIKQVGNLKIYTAQSIYKNKVVGFAIQVPNNTNGKSGFGDRITINSLGVVSDNLRKALAEIYKVKIDNNGSFVKSITASYVDLGQFFQSAIGKKTDQLMRGMREIKLFFENSNYEAELYLNIKEDDKQIQLREKDIEYRQSIIQFFTQK